MMKVKKRYLYEVLQNLFNILTFHNACSGIVLLMLTLLGTLVRENLGQQDGYSNSKYSGGTKRPMLLTPWIIHLQ